LIVPRYRLNSFGRRCFAVADPSTWNSLPDRQSLRPSTESQHVYASAEDILFLRNIDEKYSAHNNVLYIFTLYLLTYLRKTEQSMDPMTV